MPGALIKWWLAGNNFITMMMVSFVIVLYLRNFWNGLQMSHFRKAFELKMFGYRQRRRYKNLDFLNGLFNRVDNKGTFNKSLPVSGFELQTPGARSNCSANKATTTRSMNSYILYIVRPLGFEPKFKFP